MSADAAHEIDPLVGQVVQGRFRVIARLAAGGMGVVYKAEQVPLGRVVALKILESKQNPTIDASFSRRFFLEASAAASLAHPNTIVVHDYGKSDEGLYFIAMEYLDGGCLGRRLQKQGPLSPSDAIYVGLQVCGSLADAHDRGLVHRDLKPGNVMFAPRGGDPLFAKVLDFGLVKMVGEDSENLALTQSGVMMGSPRYMAPEQVKAQPVDHRADIYAFGAMFYHMVAGAPPFAAGSAFEAMHAHVSTPPPPLRATWPGCPAGPQLEALIMRCLAKDPAARPASMQEVMAMLRACQQEAGAQPQASGGWIAAQSQALSLVASNRTPAPIPGSISGVDSNPSISNSGIKSSPSVGGADSRVYSKTMRFEANEPAPPPTAAAPVPAAPAPASNVLLKVLVAVLALALVAAVAAGAAVLAFVPRGVAPQDPVAAPAVVEPVRAQVPAPTPPAPLVAPPLVPVAPAPTPTVVADTPAPPSITPLLLQSDPSGASVRRDGRDLGDTPVPLLIPRGERWTIEVSHAGYEPRTVTVEGGQPSLTLHLERARGPVRPYRPGSAQTRPLTPTPQPLAPQPLSPQPLTPRPRRDPRTPDLDDPWANQR